MAGPGSSWDSDAPRGWRGLVGRFFSPGTGFFDWSITLYTAWGIRVRLHILFILIETTLLLQAVQKGVGVWSLTGTVATFALVLIHEYGHAFACRWVKGEADDILLWPLGGLAFCRPPHNWRDSLITTLGGPGTHLVNLPFLAAAVWAIGGRMDALVFNPLSPWAGLFSIPDLTWWKTAIWFFYYKNMALFLFNMCLPMFPMDAGRVLQELLWRKMGYRRSMAVALNAGLFFAIATGIVSLAYDEARFLLGIAIFAGFICWGERQKLRYMEQAGELEQESPWAESLAWREDDERKKFDKAAKKQQQAAAAARQEQAEVDRILAKIATQGMQSLSRGEKKVLERETQRKRDFK